MPNPKPLRIPSQSRQIRGSLTVLLMLACVGVALVCSSNSSSAPSHSLPTPVSATDLGPSNGERPNLSVPARPELRDARPDETGAWWLGVLARGGNSVPQSASSTTQGDAMFTVGLNVDNYYRLYVSGGNLFGLKKIGTVKTTLFTIPYDPVNHRFLRIRHDAVANTVILETARVPDPDRALGRNGTTNHGIRQSNCLTHCSKSKAVRGT